MRVRDKRALKDKDLLEQLKEIFDFYKGQFPSYELEVEENPSILLEDRPWWLDATK